MGLLNMPRVSIMCIKWNQNFYIIVFLNQNCDSTTARTGFLLLLLLLFWKCNVWREENTETSQWSEWCALWGEWDWSIHRNHNHMVVREKAHGNGGCYGWIKMTQWTSHWSGGKKTFVYRQKKIKSSNNCSFHSANLWEKKKSLTFINNIKPK